MMTDIKEKGCGNCALFAYEDTDGFGICQFHQLEMSCNMCCDDCIEENTEEKQ